MRPLDVAVAGCGPAGLAAALFLARDGHRVTIFERFAAARPVGSGLMIQPTGLAVLERLGLAGGALARGARIRRLFGLSSGGRVVLDVRYAALRAGAFGLGLHRAALFDLLHAAATAAAIPVETGRAVRAAPLCAGGRRLDFADGSSAGPFALVVDALGAGSTLAPATGRALAYGALWASLAWPADAPFDGAALEQRYVSAKTMAGVLPIGAIAAGGAPQAAFFWSLRADALDDWRRAPLDAWKSRARQVWPQTAALLDQIGAHDDLTFARYAHRTLRAPAQEGLIHIGDAWRSTSPQLGQGANMALLDAFALAKALREAPTLAEALGRAVALRRAHVRLYQTMSALFTPVYQSDSRLLPLLRDRLVGPLAGRWPAAPILARMVAGEIGRPLRRLGLDEG